MSYISVGVGVGNMHQSSFLLTEGPLSTTYMHIHETSTLADLCVWAYI